MSLFYRFQYLVGLKPWEQMPTLPIGEQAVMLLDRVESGRQRPYGRALDLGCGAGIWSVLLDQRGWEVTGVEIVPKAVRSARENARRAGRNIRFVEGSVTDLKATGIMPGFRLLLDFGTVHGLAADEVRAVGREITDMATPDATLLMYAFAPGHRGLLPRGIDRNEIERAYTAWSITHEEAFDVAGAPAFVRKAQPRFYCLRRRQP